MGRLRPISPFVHPPGSTLDALADLLVGARCPGCHSPGPSVCPSCRDEVESSVATPTARMLSPPLQIWAAGPYGGATRRLLTSFKERGRASLAGLLGSRLAAAVAGMALACDVVDPIVLVPVPSRPDVVRRRSYDAVALMAAEAAVRLADAGAAASWQSALQHRRVVADQAGLDHVARTQNLAGALVAHRIGGALVVVVDDIVTTGASLSESARALRVAGCAVLGGATVASTVLRTASRRPVAAVVGRSMSEAAGL